METFVDKLQGWGVSLLLHAICFGALFVGLSWTETTRPVKVPGVIMEATLMQPPTRTATQDTPAQKTQQRSSKPAETAQEKAKPDELIVQEQRLRRQEEAVRQQALAERKAEEVKQAELKKQEAARQEQERLRKLEEVRAQRQEAERKRKDEELRLRKIEEERDRQAEQQRKDLERKRMQEIMDAEIADRERLSVGQEGEDASLKAQYQAAVTLAIRNAWLRPATARAGLSCVVRVHQIPGGDVVARNVVSWKCNGDEAVQRSIEAAVDRASPLPYKGYESVFERELEIDFRPTGG